MQDILGLKDVDLVGVIPGALEMMEMKKEVLCTGIANRRELNVEVEADDGVGVRLLVIACEPLFGNEGGVLGVTTALIDVTEQVWKFSKVNKYLKWSVAPLLHLLRLNLLQFNFCGHYMMCGYDIELQAMLRERLAQMKDEVAKHEVTEKKLRHAIAAAGVLEIAFSPLHILSSFQAFAQAFFPAAVCMHGHWVCVPVLGGS